MSERILTATEIEAAGKAILRILDVPCRKSDIPIKPLIVEFFGQPKAGKDNQLVRADRRFKRLKFQTLVHQEGAESEDIRKIPRDFSFSMQMQYFAQALDRLLHAGVSRDFHIIFFNRGVVDILVWLEFQLRLEKITQLQHDTARAFILNGPWMQTLDAVICLTVSVEAALEREYGQDYKTKDVKFGSMMNPKSLLLMQEVVENVCNHLRESLPELPLFVVDTTRATEKETEMSIASVLFGQFEERLKIGEDQTLPWNTSLMKERAWIAGPEIKIRGGIIHEKLRNLGWQLEATVREIDEYVVPRGRTFLEDGECFHLRTSGERSYLAFKRNTQPAYHRPKICIPVDKESIKDVLAAFLPVVTLRKEREIFTRNGLILHRDRVEALGEFVEVKGTAETTEAKLIELVRELGFAESDIVSETYVQLYLKGRATK